MNTWEKVQDINYFKGVMHNVIMCAKESELKKESPGVFVRFGIQGSGHSPNYQIETPTGVTRFSGQSHKEFHDSPEETFEPSHLSEERFSYDEVVEMMAKLKK